MVAAVCEVKLIHETKAGGLMQFGLKCIEMYLCVFAS